MPMFTTIRAIMRPRRLRSSMNRVAIMPPVGIHEPRWSVRTGCAGWAESGAGRRCRGWSSFRLPQSAGDLEEPRLERGLDLLEPVDRDAALDEHAVDLGDDVAARCPPASVIPSAVGADLDVGPDGGAVEQGAGPVGLGALDLDLEARPRPAARRSVPGG